MTLPAGIKELLSTRTSRRLAVGGALVLIGHTVLITLLRDRPASLAVAGDVLLSLETLAAAILVGAAADRYVRQRERGRLAWLLLALALLCNALAQVIWTTIEIKAGEVPVPSLADPFYLAFYPLFACGIVLLPSQAGKRADRLKLLLEMSSALLAGTLLFGVFGIGPLIGTPNVGTLELVTILAYPAGDLAILWALVFLISRQISASDRLTLVLLAAATMVNLATDWAYSAQTATNTYISGSYLDLGYALASLLFLLAAARELTRGRSPAGASAGGAQAEQERAVLLAPWSSGLPHLGLLAAFFLLVWHHYHPTAIDFGVVALIVALIIALVSARQALALSESREFARSQQELAERKQAEAVLRRARDELEQRVQERTRALEAAVQALEHEVAQHQEAEAQLQSSLGEKEVLLKEVHHRVKNNLQVVSSLLGLQSRKAADAFAGDLLRESQGRVRTMALIHQKLYASPDLGRVDFQDYLQTLLKDLFDTYRVMPGSVMFRTAVAPAWLSIDTAVPCGLIVNELVSNALKHAFPDGRKGCICVRLEDLDGHTLRLSVEDDGVGLPSGLDYRRTDSLGLQLAVTLTNQLDGSIVVDCTHGTTFQITFTPA